MLGNAEGGLWMGLMQIKWRAACSYLYLGIKGRH